MSGAFFAIVVPVGDIDASLKMFSNPYFQFVTKIDASEFPFVEQAGGVVFQLERSRRGSGRFVKKSEMARAGEAGLQGDGEEKGNALQSKTKAVDQRTACSGLTMRAFSRS